MENQVILYQRPEPIRASRREWMLLLFSALAAALFAFGHPALISGEWRGLPGAGLTACCWLMLAAYILRLGGREAGWSPQSVGLLAAAALLSLTYALRASWSMALMNLPFLAALFALAAFSLAGETDLFTASGVARSLRRWGYTLFRYVFVPFSLLRGIGGGEARRRGFRSALAGACAAFLLGAAALRLLTSADAVFGDLIARLAGWIQPPDLPSLTVNAVRFLAVTLTLFSFGWGLARYVRPAAKEKSFVLPPIVPCMALSALTVIYGIFAYIQLRYLFLGAESAAMRDGYAQYARTGFFQLVAASCITVAAALPAVCLCPDGRAVRLLSAAAALLTLVILASATWRMVLYIRAFGLTVLRVVTLWGILVIGLAMLAAMAKAACPRLRVFPALAAAAIFTWLCLNYGGVESRIARYNIAAYQSGTLERLDRDYLCGLSPDCRPAVTRWAETSEEGRTLLRQMDAAWASRRPGWFDWSLPWRSVPEGETARPIRLLITLDTREDIYQLSMSYFLNGEPVSVGGLTNASPRVPLSGGRPISVDTDFFPERDDLSGLSVQLFLADSPDGEAVAAMPPVALPASCGEYAIRVTGNRATGYAATLESEEPTHEP